MDSNGDNEHALTSDVGEDFSPRWSPDGASIAFLSDRGGQIDLYVMNADGTDVLQLTNSPAAESAPDWRPF